jgi:hypothetical protein
MEPPPHPKKNSFAKNYIYVHKETVVGALRLLQYFQLPDKKSRDISRYIYTFFALFKSSCRFIPNDVLWNPKVPPHRFSETVK